MKPIAGVHKPPFGREGINVIVAKDSRGNILTDLHIRKQSSGNGFSLKTCDDVRYRKVQLTAEGTDGTVFVASTPISVIKEKLANNHFVIQVFDDKCVLLGYARKITKHQVILGDDTVVYDVNLTAACSGIKVTKIDITNPNVMIKLNDTYLIPFKIIPDDATDKTLTYTSEFPDIASVSDKGLVKALSVGTSKITLKNEASDISASTNMNVFMPVSSIVLTNPSMTMDVGDSEKILYTTLPSDASYTNMTYSSSNSSVASIGGAGIVNAKAVGTTNIKVLNNVSGVSSTAVYTVVIKAKEINGNDISLDEGKTAMLTYTVLPENTTDKSVTFTSQNTAIATVSSAGLVSAKTVGTTTITIANASSGISKVLNVTVTSVQPEE